MSTTHLERAAPSPDALYYYRAKITRVVDGDTVIANIDLGIGTWINGERLRLYGIDTPEVRGVEDRQPGLAAAEALRGMVEECGGEVIIRTHLDKKGKFGRLLAEIWDGRPGLAGAPSFNSTLLSLGHAVEYMEG